MNADEHLDSSQLDALLLADPAAVESAAAHLAGCADCASRLEALREEQGAIDDALRVLDHALPRLGVDVVIARAQSRSRTARSLLAAGVAALLLASAAVAVPGSPVRRWLDRLAAGGDSPSAAVPSAAPEAESGGVQVVPGDVFELAFVAHQDSGVIWIALAAVEAVEVRAIGRSVAFDVGPRGVNVDNRGGTASYDIVIPETAALVRVSVAGEVVFATDRQRIDTRAPRDDRGRFVVSLVAREAGRQPSR